MSVYEELGVRRVINAATSWTVLGGSKMPAEVLDAMRDAAGAFIDMHDFHERAGAELARLTRNEAAYITAGCAAGIALAVLGCRTRGDLSLIARLPTDPSIPDEVVMHAAHRNPYDPAVLLAGARIRQIGNVKQTFDWELESAITDRTAAILYVAGSTVSAGSLPLAEVVRIAHTRNVPVIVDAAAQLPPVSNLWRFTKELGADIALFSGGKELRGPQASGLMVGRAELVEAARANGAPNQRIARAMKVGKEEMAGLIAAVRRYLALDHSGLALEWRSACDRWMAAFADLPGVAVAVEDRNAAGALLPRLRIEVYPEIVGRDAAAVVAALQDGEPGVMVLGGRDGRFYLEPALLDERELEIVRERVITELSRSETVL